MTNAERQKRYRDKKRGAPVEGRWPAGHISKPAIAELMQLSRTLVCMASWIKKHAPDVAPDLQAGRLKTTPTYKRLKAEYDAGVVAAIAGHDGRAGEHLVSSRPSWPVRLRVGGLTGGGALLRIANFGGVRSML